MRRALAEARAGAALAREHSNRLRQRAAGATHAAVAARDLVESHRVLWQHWHRVWSALAATDGPRLVRLCAYCGAADLAHADPSGPPGWAPVPPWVREHLGAGGIGLRASHGACPACAEAHLGGA